MLVPFMSSTKYRETAPAYRIETDQGDHLPSFTQFYPVAPCTTAVASEREQTGKSLLIRIHTFQNIRLRQGARLVKANPFKCLLHVAWPSTNKLASSPGYSTDVVTALTGLEATCL